MHQFHMQPTGERALWLVTEPISEKATYMPVSVPLSLPICLTFVVLRWTESHVPVLCQAWSATFYECTI
jgi:hypothetical protein